MALASELRPTISTLTSAQNVKMLPLMEFTEQGQNPKPSGGKQLTKAQRETAELLRSQERNERFDRSMHDVEWALGQFVCPTHVAPPPKVQVVQGDASAPARRPLNLKEQQRKASERLYLGSSFVAVKRLPPRIVCAPPAKALEEKLKTLRADAAARLALEQRADTLRRERYEQARKGSGDFVKRNVLTASRPRFKSPPPADEDDRVFPWRPGGAPADAFLRPAREARPESAVRRSTASFIDEATYVPPGGWGGRKVRPQSALVLGSAEPAGRSQQLRPHSAITSTTKNARFESPPPSPTTPSKPKGPAAAMAAVEMA